MNHHQYIKGGLTLVCTLPRLGAPSSPLREPGEVELTALPLPMRTPKLTVMT